MPKITHFTSLLRDFDAALNQFKALDLGMSDEERYPSCGIGCYDPKKKTYPSIYLTGPKDDFMDLPDSGEAVIKYQVTRRSTEETDGKKRHSLTLEVRSIDPKASQKAEAKKKAEGRAVAIAMSNDEGGMTEFLGGTAGAPVLVPLLNGGVAVHRTPTKMLKTRRAPVVMKKTGEGGEIRVTYRKKTVPDAGRREATAYYTDDVQDARNTAAHMVKQARKGQAFSEFNRPRDGDGQFVANVTGGADPVTMRQAYGPSAQGAGGTAQGASKSKLLAPGAAAAALGGTALLGTKAGRVMAVKGAKGASRMVRSAVTGIERKAKGRSTERYPIMGSRAPKGKPGFGETLMRQRMRGD